MDSITTVFVLLKVFQVEEHCSRKNHLAFNRVLGRLEVNQEAIRATTTFAEIQRRLLYFSHLFVIFHDVEGDVKTEWAAHTHLPYCSFCGGQGSVAFVEDLLIHHATLEWVIDIPDFVAFILVLTSKHVEVRPQTAATLAVEGLVHLLDDRIIFCFTVVDHESEASVG